MAKKNLCRNVTKHFLNLMKTLNPHILKSSYLKHDKADHIKTHRNQIPENACEEKKSQRKIHIRHRTKDETVLLETV